MNLRTRLLIIGLLALATASAQVSASGSRIKDMARVQGARSHPLYGYGIVTGLAGTGDAPGNKATRQSLANLYSQFGVSIPSDSVSSRNVAAVMVSAALPAYARQGDTLDLTVTSVGDARSLVGGMLLITALQGPDGKVYALGQGPLTVGGYKYDANGTLGQKNHPTVATVPGGASVEQEPLHADLGKRDNLTLSLMEPDFTNAARVADAINAAFAGAQATPTDNGGVTVRVPASHQGRFVDFVRQIEGLEFQPDAPSRVVVNERTGTVIAGARVRVSSVAISYGDLKISIATDNSVSQPTLIAGFQPGVTTERVSNSRVDIEERSGATLVTQPGGTVADLVQALGRLRTSARDIVSILKALKAAGALHADLIVQ
ncbi:flagellar basal body P-ring protein FlgI [Niveibacterium sp. COAC-50]|uniref:flagellar basal body P-ring protein FlgI n=1 Tax=Niveibacterium sp. COAC-50 TaxID=2729384 RepID=UPI0015528F3D|nr:flagellar basal body P-ring protein FlgI [Niveibacterium sp. COAC-50]